MLSGNDIKKVEKKYTMTWIASISSVSPKIISRSFHIYKPNDLISSDRICSHKLDFLAFDNLREKKAILIYLLKSHYERRTVNH